MNNVLDVAMTTFRDEAAERLVEAESALLELKTAPASGALAELIDGIFRALHTVKGASAMVGLDRISTLAHDIETVFARVRDGRLEAGPEVVNLSLAGLDVIRAMIADPEVALDTAARGTVAELRVLGAREPKGEGTALAGELVFFSDDPPATTEPETFRIRFRPRPTLLQEGGDLTALFKELAGLGACKVVADLSEVPPLETLDAGTCYLAWDIQIATTRGVDAVRDAFLVMEDGAELRIDKVEDAVASSPSGKTAPPAPEQGPAARQVRADKASGGTVRVAAERLDELVDLVGELVIAQARLLQIAAHRHDDELTTVAEDLARLTAELRDSTLGVRMVPIGTTFSRFNRLVHDLAEELGKDIELETRGADTELDKTVIERLADPLLHLIRNSCDHGIEAPGARTAAGKSARAKVILSAYHAGRHVVVEIRDDGAGLDQEAIRKRAVERKLIEPSAHLTEEEITGLIFLPGFSTAKTVSNVSGRGVGMDVVKRAIDALRGTVEIESVRGQGTCIRITLPLTLAIIEGLLVEVGRSSYVLPMSVVEECVELNRADVARAHGNRVTPVRGELVPYLRLRDWFQVEGDGPAIEQITIVTAAGLRCGLVVDHVVGQHQTVIKSLGSMYAGVKGISGATILGNGEVALIVDVPVLLRAASTPSSRSASA